MHIWAGRGRHVPETHVPLRQSESALHARPSAQALQVGPPQSTSDSRPFAMPSEHDAATHAPPTQDSVAAQATAAPHAPAASHVCTPPALHCVDPGWHTPVHVPRLHTYAHAVLFCHTPVTSHVCATSPLHCLVPGTHTPVQAPPTHAWFVHATAVPHVPLALHV